MISKLETAGLGFYVKKDRTTDRLGKIDECNNFVIINKLVKLLAAVSIWLLHYVNVGVF